MRTEYDNIIKLSPMSGRGALKNFSKKVKKALDNITWLW